MWKDEKKKNLFYKLELDKRKKLKTETYINTHKTHLYIRVFSSRVEYSLLGHSSGFGRSVCLRELSGSYSKATLLVGFHLACSFPNPFTAYARRRSDWPLRSFTMRMSGWGRVEWGYKSEQKTRGRKKNPIHKHTQTHSPSLSPYSLASSSLCLDVTGMTLASDDLRSAVLICLVWSSWHLTSRVNSTEHSGQ